MTKNIPLDGLVRRWSAGCRRRVEQLLQHRDAGSEAIEVTAMILPLFILVMLVVVFHRAAADNQAVDAAAYDAARAASISRTVDEAGAAAQAAAAASLAQNGLTCADRTVTPNLGGFAVPVGEPATVSVTVSCTATSDGLWRVTGSRTFTSTAVSPLDSFRERT